MTLSHNCDLFSEFQLNLTIAKFSYNCNIISCNVNLFLIIWTLYSRNVIISYSCDFVCHNCYDFISCSVILSPVNATLYLTILSQLNTYFLIYSRNWLQCKLLLECKWTEKLENVFCSLSRWNSNFLALVYGLCPYSTMTWSATTVCDDVGIPLRHNMSVSHIHVLETVSL